jgi:hypothetical protein
VNAVLLELEVFVVAIGLRTQGRIEVLVISVGGGINGNKEQQSSRIAERIEDMNMAWLHVVVSQTEFIIGSWCDLQTLIESTCRQNLKS